MYYFLPSWYSQGEKWSRYEDNWYLSEEVPEFDDTVGQVRLFSQAGEKVEILSLAYSPHLRRFLHLIGEGGASYWSAFDTLQGIQRRSIGLYSYKEMSWPKLLAWSYTPYEVEGFLGGEPYARVEFGPGGSMIYIDRILGPEKIIRNYFDDRGFLSSRLLLKKGRPIRQEFFDERGALQFTHEKSSDMVFVSENAHFPFASQEYATLGDVLEEVLAAYTGEHFQEEDALIIASDPRHNEMALRSPGLGVRVLSFYENRYPLEDVDQLRKEVELGDMVITDTQILTEGICAICGIKRGKSKRKKEVPEAPSREVSLESSLEPSIEPSKEDLPGEALASWEEELEAPQEEEQALSGYLGSYPVPWRPVFDIPPYDARLSLGHSQTLWESKILMPLGEMEREKLEEVFSRLLSYLSEREKAVLVLCVKGGEGEKQRLRHWLRKLMDALGLDLTMETGESSLSENEVGTEEIHPPKIQFCGAGEESIRVALGDCRVVLDLSKVPRLYVQIASISAGVPQITFATSRYVQDKKNGYILHSLGEIEQALDYYLQGLSNWNQALIYNVNKIASYTDGRIVAHWKDALEKVR